MAANPCSPRDGSLAANADFDFQRSGSISSAADPTASIQTRHCLTASHTRYHKHGRSQSSAALEVSEDGTTKEKEKGWFNVNIGEAVLGEAFDIDDEDPTDEKHWLIDNAVFKGCIAFMVLLNTVQMGLEVDRPDWEVWPLCEHVFTAAFTLEAILKICVLKFKYFKQSWNLLDFSLASLSVLDTWVMMLFSSASIDLQQLSILRILRLVRLVRVVRLMKSAQQMVLVITGVMEAMQTTCWIALVLCMCVYVFGIFFTKTFGQGAAAESYPGYSRIEEEIDEQEIMANYNPYLCFGSLPKSVLTLFNIAILSEWSEITRPVFQKQPECVIFFIIFVMFVTFGVMNVFIGMIVEKVTTNADDNQKAREYKAKQAKLKLLGVARQEIFKLPPGDIDLEQAGCEPVSACALEKLVEGSKNLQKILENMDLPEEFGVSEFIYMLDNNGDGGVDAHELVENFERLVMADEFKRICISQTGINEIKFLINSLRKDLLGTPTHEHPGHDRPAITPFIQEMQELIEGMRKDMNERFTEIERQIWASKDSPLGVKANTGEGRTPPLDDGTGGTGGPGAPGHRAGVPSEQLLPLAGARSRVGDPLRQPTRGPVTGEVDGHSGIQPSPSPMPSMTAECKGAPGSQEGSPHALAMLSKGRLDERSKQDGKGAPGRRDLSLKAHTQPSLPLGHSSSNSASSSAREVEAVSPESVEVGLNFNDASESAEAAVVFDEHGKLGFEVIWSDPPRLPAVGTVHDGGQASRHGLRSGDLLIKCNGQMTKGKSRSDILGILSTRPLTLTLGRGLEEDDVGGHMAAGLNPLLEPDGDNPSLDPAR